MRAESDGEGSEGRDGRAKKSLHESIPSPRHGVNMSRVRRVRLNLLAQAAHELRQAVVAHAALRAAECHPDMQLSLATLTITTS